MQYLDWITLICVDEPGHPWTIIAIAWGNGLDQAIAWTKVNYGPLNHWKRGEVKIVSERNVIKNEFAKRCSGVKPISFLWHKTYNFRYMDICELNPLPFRMECSNIYFNDIVPI